LASSHIISFLINRGKPMIYSTAPSVIDTALALVNIEYVAKNAQKFYKKIKNRHKIIKDELNIEISSLILTLPMPSNSATISKQKELIEEGFLIGAIRQPTVNQPILRIIPRIGSSKQNLLKLCKNVKITV